MPTIRQSIQDAAERFEGAGVYFGHGTDNPADEAAWLAMHVTGLSPHDLEEHLDQPLEPGVEFEALVAKRIATRKPVAYLIHEAWFAGLRFYVDERVLIPRSHLAEFIQERFVPWLVPEKTHRILDLCTGSGCIAVALAAAFPDAHVDAADISTDALAVAQRNVAEHGVGNRVELVASDLFANLAGRRYDLIVTNPPYVPAGGIKEFPAEYAHEPALALAAGPFGLDSIVAILRHASAHLNPGGLFAAEVGAASGALEAAFPRVPFTWLATSYGEPGVFVLTAEELNRHHREFSVPLETLNAHLQNRL